MYVFINLIKRDPQVGVKKNDMLDRYNRLPLKHQSETGYNSLIQNVIRTELIKIRGTTIKDLDIDLKMKISRINILKVDYYILNDVYLHDAIKFSI